jgi:hypothetical protein
MIYFPLAHLPPQRADVFPSAPGVNGSACKDDIHPNRCHLREVINPATRLVLLLVDRAGIV